MDRMNHDYSCQACNAEFVAEHGMGERPKVPCPHCKSLQTALAGGGPNVPTSLLFAAIGLILGLLAYAAGLCLLALIVALGKREDFFSTLPRGFAYARTGTRTHPAFMVIFAVAFLGCLIGIGWLAGRLATTTGGRLAGILGIRFKSHYVDLAWSVAVLVAPLVMAVLAVFLLGSERIRAVLSLMGAAP